MMKWLRNFMSRVLLGALTLSFVVWGIADVFRTNVSDTVATVGNTDISSQAYKSEYDKDMRLIGMQLGQSLTPEQARQYNIGKIALDNLLTETALNQTAQKMGLEVSDADVSAEIQSDRNFAGPLGTFDKKTFEQLLQMNGMTEQQYIAIIRGQMTRQQLLVPVELGFQIPDPYLSALFAAGNERRAVEFLVLTPHQAGAIAPPSDPVLAAYVRAHPERYSTPEYRDVEFAWLTPSDVAGQVTVTQAQIQQAYDASESSYVVPEKRDLEQISFPTLADAQAARKKIDQGTSFAQLATERGLKPADIALGTRVAADLDKASAAAAFSLPVNGVSEPVKSTFGYVLYHVVSITPGSTKTLAQATPELRTQLLQQLEEAKLTDVQNAYTDALGGGADVKEAAAKSGMHYGHVTAMDANGLGPDGKPVAAPDNAEFRAQIFKADVGEAGDPFNTKDGSAFALKVDGVTPPKLKPLDQVRASALAGWTEEQQEAALKAKAKALAAQATQQQSLAQVAKSIGAPVETSPALSRRTRDDTFSAELISAIFDAKAGTAVFGPLGKGEGFVVARITGIAHPAIPPGPFTEQAKQEISGTMAHDISESLASDVKQRLHTTIDQKMVDQVTGEGS